jgi:hypothetical protein
MYLGTLDIVQLALINALRRSAGDSYFSQVVAEYLDTLS